MSYTNIFGGTAVKPSQPGYLLLTISASTALVWPLEGGAESSPAVASQMDVQASLGSLLVAMPPGNTGSAGAQTLIANTGANSFTLTDTGGNQIAVIAPTQAWLIVLRSNATTNGTWGAIQIGATTSTASAGVLAGAGLQASGTQLQVNTTTTQLSANTLITASYRGTLAVWTGAVGSLVLDTIANLGAGFWFAFNNMGSGNLTLSATGGVLVNNVASLTIAPGDSGVIVAAGAQFWTFGALLGAITVAQGGTGAISAPGALSNLGGTPTGQAIFTAPSSASVLALLGLPPGAFAESTVAVNQTLNTTSGNRALVCTAALTATFPLSTTVTTNFYVLVFAQGGAVTLAPQPADAMQGQAAGTSYVLQAGQSALIVTDAAGNYWITLGGTTAGTFTSVTVSSPGTFSGFGIVPIGGQIPFGGATAPAGWLLCDGQAVSRTTKAALFTAIGTAYGAGDGATTFNVPDKRGRTSIGLDNMGGTAANRVTVAGSGVQSTTLGGTGGDQNAQKDTLSASSPAVSNVTDPGHNHAALAAGNFLVYLGAGGGIASTGGSQVVADTTTANAATGISVSTTVSTTVTSSLTGASQNMPPVQAENWIIYAAA